jgi:hypothetical protein
MPSKQPEQQQTNQGNQGEPKRNAAIARSVLHSLGQPHDLYMVQVRPLWEDCYRVNVFLGVDAATAKVAHSYFLVVDSAGTITASTPRITRRY